LGLEIEEILELLDIDIDKRLYQLEKKQLVSLLTTIIQGKSKKDLAKLLSDDNHFTVLEIIKTLEKKDKKLLFRLLNEPKDEKELRLPLRNWLKQLGYEVEFEVPYPGPGRRRFIDVVGFKKGGFFTSDEICAIEIKISPSRSAIDSAFSQAKDYQRCSDFTYVAVSPYLFLKYPDVVIQKARDYRKIGLILVDKYRVINVLREAEENKYDDELWEKIRMVFVS